MKFHINDNNEPKICQAKKRCRFGDFENDHFDNIHDATKEAELRNADVYSPKRPMFSKNSSDASNNEVEISKKLENVDVIPHELILSNDTKDFLEKLSVKGFTPYVVGGAVRDSLREGVEPKDVDIEVFDAENIEELSNSLKRMGFQVDEVGKSFGVLKICLKDGMDLDVSLPRRDSLIGSGHRDFKVEVDPNLSLTDAAARRDFTINALYYSHDRKAIIDAHNGHSDWNNKILRHVSDAYSEDPLRVLRAVQISSRFGLTLAPETVSESKRIKDSFNSLSVERVREEFNKLFNKSEDVSYGLKVLQDTGWAEHFGLQNMDTKEVSKKVNMSMKAARENDLSPAVYGAAALARAVDTSERKKFLNLVSNDSKSKEFSSKLANLSLPEKVKTEADAYKWSREFFRENKMSVRDFVVFEKSYNPKKSKDMKELCLGSDSYYSAPNDLVTGEMVLRVTGESKGGRWIGDVLKKAQEAQDNLTFSDSVEAETWLSDFMESYTKPS